MDTQLTTISKPVDLISQAIEKGLGVDELGKLLDLQERWEANQAKKAFLADLIEFQNECPDIRKTKGVSFKEGGPVVYHYAPLPDIIRQIKPLEKKFGFVHRWEFDDTKDELKVTCLISHRDGHTERTTMGAGPDKSGSKNDIQARGSAIEFLKRYTLIGAFGLSTTDTDIDGRFPQDQDIDKLHRDFMDVYNRVIQLDSTLSKWNPDNWKVDRTAKVYIKSTGELRKILFELQNKGK